MKDRINGWKGGFYLGGIYLLYSWIIKESKNVGMKHRTSGDLRLSLALQIEWVKGSETTVIDVDSETKRKWLSSIYP